MAVDCVSTGRQFLRNAGIKDEEAPDEFAAQIGYQMERQEIERELARFKKASSAFPKVGGGTV